MTGVIVRNLRPTKMAEFGYVAQKLPNCMALADISTATLLAQVV